MKLAKAIEILNDYIDDPLIVNKHDFIAALKRNIQCTQYVIACREFPHLADNTALPPDEDD